MWKFIHNAKAMKIVLSVLIVASFVTALLPGMAVHAAILGVTSNLLWVWEI